MIAKSHLLHKPMPDVLMLSCFAAEVSFGIGPSDYVVVPAEAVAFVFDLVSFA